MSDNSIFGIPVFGGILRGAADLASNFGIGPFAQDQAALGKAINGLTAPTQAAWNKAIQNGTYTPAMDPTVQGLLAQAQGASAAAFNTANGINTQADGGNNVNWGNWQNAGTNSKTTPSPFSQNKIQVAAGTQTPIPSGVGSSSGPGISGLNDQIRTLQQYANMARTGDSPALGQLQQGQQQAAQQAAIQARSVGGMTPGQLQAAMAQGSAVQGQNDVNAQNTLRAQTQLQGLHGFAQNAGLLGQNANSATGSALHNSLEGASAGLASAANAGSYGTGVQSLGQNYLNTLANNITQGVNHISNYNSQNDQYGAALASGAAHVAAGLLLP